MDFGAPVVVHSLRSKSDVKTTPIVGANWTNTRGQILITEPYSVRLCHRDHGNILRAWTFRPDAMEAFVGVGAKMITEGRVRWIVARRKNGKVVAWREDDETGTLNMSKFSDVPTNGEASNNGSICNSKEIVISVSPERSVRLLVDSSNSISCTGWDTVFDVPLRTMYLPQQNASISKFADKILSSSISNDKKSLLVVLKTAVYVIGLTLHPSTLANVVGRRHGYTPVTSLSGEEKGNWESRGIVVAPDWESLSTGPGNKNIWDVEIGSATSGSRVETKFISSILKQKTKKGFEDSLIEYIEAENQRRIDNEFDTLAEDKITKKILLGDRFIRLVVNECLDRKCWNGLLHLILTCSISARSVPSMIPSILRAKKGATRNTSRKRRRVSNVKKDVSSGNKMYVADANFICHILDNVYDISETMLVAILQFSIRHLDDSDSFTKVMNSILRAPFNGLFMSRSLKELTNPEVKVVLLYLRRGLKQALDGSPLDIDKEIDMDTDGENEDVDAGTSIRRRDKILPRLVAWCSMVLDAHFNGVIMRSVTTEGDLLNVITSVKNLVDNYIESCRVSEALQVQLTHFKKVVDGAQLPAAVVPEYSIEVLMV